MIIILGLGNPGKKFEKTRHNVGFRVLDEFLKKVGFSGFSLTRLRQGFGGQAKKSSSLISEGKMDTQKIILVKPQTFMNNSGKAVKKIIENYKLKIENLVVVHDDIDLALGKIRIVKNRGAAGHKGVESIIKELGTKNFVRFRIGIKPSQETRIKKQETEKFVLQKFNKDEEEILEKVIKKTIEAIGFASNEGLEKAMNRYNQ